MVIAVHSMEARALELIARGHDWSLDDLGGVKAVAKEAVALGASPIMAELLEPLLQGLCSAPDDQLPVYRQVVRDLLEAADMDFVLVEAIDVLDAYRPLPGEIDDDCFEIFLNKAAKRDTARKSLLRSAALEGAFRWSSSKRTRQLQLLLLLLGLSKDDDPEYLRHAAKIIGVAYSYWREADLLKVLHELVPLERVCADATFELGMASLSEALDLTADPEAMDAFRRSRHWFAESEQMSDGNAEAALYRGTLDVLLDFGGGDELASFRPAAVAVEQQAFAFLANSDEAGPEWLGSRFHQGVCWSALASTLVSLSKRLEEPSWYYPAVVIEQGLLSVYTASRSILRRTQQGGVESVVRPRIGQRLAAHAGLAHQVRTWLAMNASHDWAAEAKQLVGQIDALLEHGSPHRNPGEAANDYASLAAMVAKSKIPVAQRELLASVVRSVLDLQLENLTGAEIEVVEACCTVARTHPDYKGNANGARLFNVVLLWLVRFVFNRLELSRGTDPGGAYLFERSDGSLPHEDELQHDFFRWISTNAAGTDLEPTNVGSGRADVRLKSGPERLIVEVKREESDCSFDSLAKAYAAQTTDYQNVSIRLGVLLVLDLATPNREGTSYITNLFEMKTVQRTAESTPRLVLIAKVPGRRKVPSALSR